ncbi:diguanylate cyclase [Actinoplanes sp. NPDC051861]|uniref:diguanylate cyclase domain-containing protein n=1 Tax=Actinoplanes sp. NPDC051861 TaxID=3155170 RepID=UPI0034142469
MRSGWARVVDYLRHGVEPIMVLAVVAVLYRLGLAGHAPFWLLTVVLFAGMVYQQPGLQRRLAGGDLTQRVAPRVAVHLLLVSLTMYLVGWGPVLAVAHLQIASVHLGWSGSRAWRPAALASAAMLLLGQLAIAAGWVSSYLPQPAVHGAAALIAIGTVTTCRVLGLSVHRSEEAELALRRSEERLEALLHDGTDMIVVWSSDGEITYASPAAGAMIGHSPERLVGRPIAEFIHPDDAGAVAALGERAQTTDSSTAHRAELRVRTAGGAWRWHEATVRNLLGNPAVRGIVAHHRDITEHRADRERIAYAATHDGLTGLVNATAFSRSVAEALDAGRRRVGLLFLDLDGFKPVNDTYGHEVGDQVLRMISEMIRAGVPRPDLVGRLGGDEFGVLLDDLDDQGGEEEAIAVARRLIDAFDSDLVVDGRRVRVGCSVGIALASPGAGDAPELLRHADQAMYRAKRAGNNRFTVHAEATA